MTEDNGWAEWRIHVREELKRGSDERKQMMDLINTIYVSMESEKHISKLNVTNNQLDIKQNSVSLNNLHTTLDTYDKRLIGLETAFKIKASLWGAIGASIPTAIGGLIIYLVTS